MKSKEDDLETQRRKTEGKKEKERGRQRESRKTEGLR